MSANPKPHSLETYPIPTGFAERAHIDAQGYHAMYKQSIENPDTFWGEQARRFLTWEREFTTVKDTSFAKDNVHIKWFEDGTLNVSVNCVDRHAAERGDVPAILWEPDDPKEKGRTLTYKQLKEEVCRTANMLKALGVKAGDRVTIYLPMIPEATISMLACARIGAMHSVVFGGFSAGSLHGRIVDCGSEVVITADEGLRGGKCVPLKANVDEACANTNVKKVLVFKRTGGAIGWQEGRDIWWHDLAARVDTNCEAPAFDAEHPLFILYTSGSTGKPKGLQHTSGGFLLHAAITFYYAFDYKPGDIHWCTADVGWVTGHTYLVYGPLAVGATTVMFEGIPTYPDASRFWQVVDKYKVTQFYTAPTAIRMLEREGEEYVHNSSRKSLRLIGSVGEPINPEAWLWYYETVGKGRCAVIDTWWQTETGGMLLSPLPGATEPKPGSACWPFFGVQPVILDDKGAEVAVGEEGALCMKDSWPGQARTIWGDHHRFVETYFTTYPGLYFSGDAAMRDADGYFWVRGRMDDILKVSGHRLGTAEIEAAINAHALVTESAVVGFPHAVKGEGIYAYVTTLTGTKEDEALRDEIRKTVRNIIGPIAIPEKIHFTPALPKTRSGKIMRRILRKIAAGEVTKPEEMDKLGDTSTLLNPETVVDLVKGRV